jgi:dipeptidyl-peptidase-4
MTTSRTTARVLSAAIALGCFACAGETPSSVFATGDTQDAEGKHGTLFYRMKTAYEHVPHPKPPPIGPQPSAAKLDETLLHSIVETRAFRLGAPTNMTPTPQGQAVLFLRSGARDTRQSLFKLDVPGGSLHELVTPERLSNAENLTAEERALRERMRTRGTGITSFEVTSDGLAIIIPYAGKIHVFDRMTGLVRQLPTSDGVVDVHLSPDGKRVGYVHADDLYVCDIDGKTTETRLTRGGTEHKPNGLAEFIAAEEFDRTRGFFFSPDGSQLVYEEADQSQVERLSIPNLAHPEHEADRPFYPRAGHSNASLRFGIINIRNAGAPTWVQWEREKFPYVATVRWEDGPLVMYVLDREQKNGQLLMVDPKTGKTTQLVAEHDDVFLEVDPSVPRFFADGKRFYWSTERDGEARLELRATDGPLLREGNLITPKNFGYRALLDIDETRNRVMVEASGEPSEAGVYAVPLTGGEPQPIGTHPGVVHAHFGHSYDA